MTKSVSETDVRSARGRLGVLDSIRAAKPPELIEWDDAIISLPPSPARDGLLEVCELEVQRRDVDGSRRSQIEAAQDKIVHDGDGEPRRWSARTSAVTPAARFAKPLADDRSAKARGAAEARWGGRPRSGER